MGQHKESAKPLSGSDCASIGGILGINPAELKAEVHEAEKARKTFWEELERAKPCIRECRDRALRGILGDELAKAAYFKLLGAGFSQPELLEIIVGMAVSVPRRGKAPDWLSDLGMTRKQIDYFPKRLNTLAGEIEKLNMYPLMRPDYWVHGRKISQTHSKGVVDQLGKRMMSLPFMLRVYAAFISGHSETMGRYLLEKSRTSPRVQILAALMRLVRSEIGRPKYQYLSLILAAAAREARLSDSGFDEPTLRMLDSRMQKKQKPNPSS